MKAILVLLGVGLVFTNADAQKINIKDVPVNVKNSFEKNYVAVDVDWDREGANYEASFDQTGSAISVVFNSDGSILETEREIKKNELPTAILNALKKDFADFELEEAARIESSGMTTYEVEIEKGEKSMDLIFDADGKLIKKHVKEEDEND